MLLYYLYSDSIIPGLHTLHLKKLPGTYGDLGAQTARKASPSLDVKGSNPAEPKIAKTARARGVPN